MKMKKWLLTALAITLSVSLVACGAKDTGNAGEDGQANESKEQGAATTLTEPIAEEPVMVTSVGQSADFEVVKTLMDKAGVEYDSDIRVMSDKLDGVKTLVLAVGGSSKGLGAAGINPDDEIKRSEELVKTAKDKGITIISMHTGGATRRGELSDKFINVAIPSSDYIIVVGDGNSDGLFTKTATEKNIPISEVPGIIDSVDSLIKAFK